MKKNILTKYLPFVAAVLLATSCSKDDNGNDDSIIAQPSSTEEVAQPEQTPEAPKTVTIPFSVKVDNGTSLSKISYTEKDGTRGRIVTREFEDGDCGKITLSITGTGVAENQSLALKKKGSDFVFYGTITVEGTYQESFDGGTMALTGTLTTNGKTDNVGYSTTSLVDLEENHCNHTFKTQSDFTSGSESITLTDQNAYLSITLPTEETSLYVNGVSYTLSGGKVWIAVDPTKKVQSARLSLFNQVVEPGHVYNITRGASTFKADAVFTVGKDASNNPIKVKFSPGNLLYQASSNGHWEFAARQWDCVGNADGNTAASANRAANVAYIDLFGWGAWVSGQSPTESETTSKYYYDESGVNGVMSGDISKEANKVTVANKEWRVLTDAEWQYLLGISTDKRDNATDLRKWRTVNSVNGLVILPDGCAENIDGEWSTLEAAGAVFLPAAGYREGASVLKAGSYACYWSSSAINAIYADFAWGVFFHSGGVFQSRNGRYYGRSVRLVSGL